MLKEMIQKLQAENDILRRENENLRLQIKTDLMFAAHRADVQLSQLNKVSKLALY